MKNDFRAINPADARIVLIEGQSRVLPMFHRESLRVRPSAALTQLKIEVYLDCHVTAIEPDHVEFKPDSGKSPTERIETVTVVWAAGVAASRAG